MQPLAPVLADVKSGRRAPWPCRPNPSIINSQESPFFSHTQRLTEVSGFGSNPGALRMLKFIPAELYAIASRVCPPTSAPIWLREQAAANDCGGLFRAILAVER